MTSRPTAVFDQCLLRDPHSRYNALRDQAPVHHVLTPDGAPAWLVTRYNDVRAAFTDPRRSVDKRFSGTDGEHGSSLPPSWTRISSTATRPTTLDFDVWQLPPARLAASPTCTPLWRESSARCWTVSPATTGRS